MKIRRLIEHRCVQCHASYLKHVSRKSKFCSRPCCVSYQKRHHPSFGKKRTAEQIQRISVSHIGKCSGKDHYLWKGGINHRDKHSLYNPQYVEWRNGVFKRDKWKCRIADKNCRGHLQAHHILRWCDYPELRYQLNNGIVLCQAHHPRKRAEEKRLEPLFRELVSVSSN